MARAVPRSAVIGLQRGLGLATAWLGLKLMWAAPLALVAAGLAVWATDGATPKWPSFAPAWPVLVLLGSWEEAWRGFWVGALPQLPLTLANALILTALLAREMFLADIRVTEWRLAVSTGLANLALAPFGAMPMCHGAGGLIAQHRFGARTGFTPALPGVLLLVLGLGYATDATALLALVPMGAVGGLLLLAGGDLALSGRLVKVRADRRPAIAATVLATLLFDPALGLAAGWAMEVAPAVTIRAAPRVGGLGQACRTPPVCVGSSQCPCEKSASVSMIRHSPITAPSQLVAIRSNSARSASSRRSLASISRI